MIQLVIIVAAIRSPLLLQREARAVEEEGLGWRFRKASTPPVS